MKGLRNSCPSYTCQKMLPVCLSFFQTIFKRSLKEFVQRKYFILLFLELHSLVFPNIVQMNTSWTKHFDPLKAWANCLIFTKCPQGFGHSQSALVPCIWYELNYTWFILGWEGVGNTKNWVNELSAEVFKCPGDMIAVVISNSVFGFWNSCSWPSLDEILKQLKI